MSTELARNLIQRIREDLKECIDNSEGCSTSTSHQLENEEDESMADPEDENLHQELENVDEESTADLDRESSSLRVQDEIEGSMDVSSFQIRSRYRKDIDDQRVKMLFSNFLDEAGLDDSVMERPGFQNLFLYVNPAVKFPEPSKNQTLNVPKTEKLFKKRSSSRKLFFGEPFEAVTTRTQLELNINEANEGEPSSSSSVSSDAIENVAERKETMAQKENIMEDSAEIQKLETGKKCESNAFDSSDDDDDTDVLKSTDTDEMVPGESERVKELVDRTLSKEPPAPGLTPCFICGNNVTNHESITMTANETIKALMAAVHCEKIKLETAEAALCQVRLKMCSTHHDNVYKWMCKAIGVKTASEVDAIPGIDLFDVLTVYRRLKGIRDAYENRNPSNTPCGSFKMAIKSYYRNYVPRKRGIVRSIKAIARIVKEDPRNNSFAKMSQDDEKILYKEVGRSDHRQHSLQSHTTELAVAASLEIPEESTSAPNDTHIEPQQELETTRLEEQNNNMPRVAGEVMLPTDDHFEEGDEKQSNQPILPPSDSPCVAKTDPEGHAEIKYQTTFPDTVPDFEVVEGRTYKAVMAENPARTLLSSLMEMSCDEEEPEDLDESSDEEPDEEMEDNQQREEVKCHTPPMEATLGPDCYPPGEFPFVSPASPLVKVEEPEDVKPEPEQQFLNACAETWETNEEVVMTGDNFEVRAVKQEIEEIDDTLMEIEELPSNWVKSEAELLSEQRISQELDLKPLVDQGLEITHVVTHQGVIIDQKKSLSPIPDFEEPQPEIGGWMPKPIPWGQMLYFSTDSLDVKSNEQPDKQETRLGKRAKPIEHESSPPPSKKENEPVQRESLSRAVKRTSYQRPSSPCSMEVELFMKPAKQRRLMDVNCDAADGKNRPSTLDDACFAKPAELQRVLESDIELTRFNREVSLPPDVPAQNGYGSMRRRSFSRTAKTYVYNRLTAPCSAMTRIQIHRMTPELA
ncbi:hypothetical protein GCK72_025498 [Caenorhabditis remanei]|uniref:Uncharacterized protein n=1 Tax=Caenorhabditis remanei TaxID=31234 RepID=A0A6A5G2R9_CAERE|nr:hypothetical protein GCK72_025498 [Caenorhabditis remanei]KAF1749031.1 hypothetical protein GCK72_025498 [Caenorhabditis remanei]